MSCLGIFMALENTEITLVEVPRRHTQNLLDFVKDKVFGIISREEKKIFLLKNKNVFYMFMPRTLALHSAEDRTHVFKNI